MGSTADEIRVEGHAGQQAFGTDTMFTLNGGHIWPLYDGARNLDMRVVDTRHEQTATFAAEAYAKLTRTPGLAVLTAGRARRPRPRRPMGRWFVAGDGPRAGPRLDHQVRRDGEGPDRRRDRGPRCRRHRAHPAPWTDVPRLPDGR